LNNHIYKGVKSEEHLDKLLATEPMWELFEHKEIVDQLFHINKHYEIVKQHLPKSVEDLAIILALIRPGKRHLVGNSWEVILSEVWEQTDSYFFKRSHAIGYATAIIVQLNLIIEQLG
jgi:DNA polymerase III alpha subunit